MNAPVSHARARSNGTPAFPPSSSLPSNNSDFDIEGASVNTGSSDAAPLVPNASSDSDPSNRRKLRQYTITSLKSRFWATLRSPAMLMALLAFMLIGIVLLSIPRGDEDSSSASANSHDSDLSLLPFDFNALHSGLFQPNLASREWVLGAKDGTYLIKDPQDQTSLLLHHVDSKETTTLVSKSDLVIDHTPFQYSKYMINPTLTHGLFESGVEKGWRHGYFAVYHLFDVEKKTLKLLGSSGTGAGAGTGKGGDEGNASGGDVKGAGGRRRNQTLRRRDEESSKSTIGEAGTNAEVPIGKGKIALAIWAPTGDSVAWVRNNNIHVTSIATETDVQITTDGSPTLYNGLADWVYEEEVLSSNTAMWFSPDGSKLAYLKFNDALVPSFKVQLYFHESTGQQYPEDLSIKYPKAGTNNPVVELFIAVPAATSASTRNVGVLFSPPESVFPDDDRLIVEAKWMEDGNSLLVRMMNRVQDQQRLYLVRSPETSDKSDAVKAAVNGTANANAWIGTLVRDEKSGDGAWLLNSGQLQPIHVLPPSKVASRPNPGYLELAEDSTGNAHIAYYNSITAKTPTHWLTKGDFEVTQIAHVDNEKSIVYYLATSPGADGSTQRHLYSVKIGGWSVVTGGGSTKLTPPKGITWTSSTRTWKLEGGGRDAKSGKGGSGDAEDRRNEGIGSPVGEVGWYDVSFSKGGGYYLVTYSGPDVPFQKVVSLHDSGLNFPFKTNEKVGANLKNYAMPRELYATIPIPASLDGKQQSTSLNAKLIVPNDFNPSDKTRKYPVLISVYGGPNSQTVTTRYSLSFETALSATGYIIMYLDPRGTCCKGRAFRSVVSKQLGKVESEDVVSAAEWLIGKGFVDAKRVAVWGWSYGGFLASKVIELNSGIVTTGIAVAPVTDWKFYDSVYTERYMKTPLLNPKGYETSAVSKMGGFKAGHFLLIHGTGDDNVHFQNSLALIWKLTSSQVHNYQVQFYPDSDHSMSAGNAMSELFGLLRRFLDTQFGMNNSNESSSKSMKRGKVADGGSSILEERHGIVSGFGFEWDVYN
ncbi:UNVERIFIED_CONTAM: hypothetical protein HDU68_006411 [Siphonaria sp. JEL0065]|nr:hypothetical protein HDU68_006411 [Siphonaria sp. JEL0065]